ncbi:hypothetical protein XI07_05170 [Bradyrhizobium sp. CCBAU 11445]|nr:hypothetical protein [Bradyrhizobium sp. CCBAU 11445]
MEWLVNLRITLPAQMFREVQVARDNCPIAHLRNAVGRIKGTIAVDYQPTIALQEKRSIE